MSPRELHIDESWPMKDAVAKKGSAVLARSPKGDVAIQRPPQQASKVGNASEPLKETRPTPSGSPRIARDDGVGRAVRTPVVRNWLVLAALVALAAFMYGSIVLKIAGHGF